ncbi:MAG: hydrolase 2, exosortase A system-associated, partial [Gammaproteobacteria bacterium]
MLRTPIGPVTKSVVYLHPFAEEMHKSRRMAALQAAALATAGCATLSVDLTGCGDSGGDFADASWSVWRRDAVTAIAWLKARFDRCVTLWGLRTGATLATDVAVDRDDIESLMLWQPVLIGEMFLNQFLRIRLAAEMFQDAGKQTSTLEYRGRLARGESIEVAGYCLTSAMARDLAGIVLGDFTPACPVRWFEVGRIARQAISPAGDKVVERWRAKGMSVIARTV